MTLSIDRQKLIDRVTKLLALANDPGAAQGEKDNAAQKAAELMAKHNIELSESSHVPEYTTENDEELDATDQFDVTMANAVAKFNDCMLLIVSKFTGKYLQVVGTRSNIEAYNYMKDVVYRQRTDAYMSAVIVGTKGRTEKARREYYLGFAVGVQHLVNDLMRRRDTVIHSMSLVPVNGAALAKTWYEQNEGKVRTTRPKLSNYDRDGYSAGRNASLNKAMSTNSGRLQIGA